MQVGVGVVDTVGAGVTVGVTLTVGVGVGDITPSANCLIKGLENKEKPIIEVTIVAKIKYLILFIIVWQFYINL